MDWKKFYTELPAQFEESEFLRQVGKTVSGQPITQDQFKAQISDIRKALDINLNDQVLDFCCGNGIITAELSKICNHIIGVDFSEPLIRIAKKYNNPGNIDYYCISALDPLLKSISPGPFTKIYMYEALQHFSEDDLPVLLERIKEISKPNTLIFLGGIPDKERIWDFYDTEERREDYRIRKSQNREAIGTWWNQTEFAEICHKNGFDCEFILQNQLLHSAHYRFDVRLRKADH